MRIHLKLSLHLTLYVIDNLIKKLMHVQQFIYAFACQYLIFITCYKLKFGKAWDIPHNKISTKNHARNQWFL